MLNVENTINMKAGVRRRLSIIFPYGGQLRDLKADLDLIGKGAICPQVETGRLGDFSKVFTDLCDGKAKAHMALLGTP